MSMTVRLCNPSVFVVDDKFRVLIPTDLSTAINGLLLGFCVDRRSLTSSLLHVPPSVRIRNNVRLLRHFNSSTCVFFH